MKTMTAKEAKNAFGRYLDNAQREPVVVTKRSRPVAVTFSMNDLPAILGFAETMKETVNAGVRAGLADSESGRMHELTDDYIEALTLKAKERIANKTTK